MDAHSTEKNQSLYERLGGGYSIAVVVDDFIDRIMVDPRLHANPRGGEAPPPWPRSRPACSHTPPSRPKVSGTSPPSRRAHGRAGRCPIRDARSWTPTAG